MLESADQALRHKPRHLSVPSSVVRSQPLKSSVQKIGMESSQSVAVEQPLSGGDVRTVVHSMAKDSSSKHRERQHHQSSKHQRSDTGERTTSHGGEQLVITVMEDNRSMTNAGDVSKHYHRSAVEERKVSVLGEDQFEPDYDEAETAAVADASTGEDGKRRHKHSRHSSSRSDPSKSKKHKKHKKSKKHKTRNKKSDN